MTAKPGETERNSYMDFLKGIAIIAVIVGHSLSGNRSMDLLFNIIYSFHMPLLFFVSAYIEEQRYDKYVGQEVRMLAKRMSGLLLPYVSWSVIYAAAGSLQNGVSPQMIFDGTLKTEFTVFWSKLWGYGENGLWFFPVLFGLKIMHVLYWVICRKTGKDMFIKDLLILGGLEIICALLAVLTKQPYLINMLSYALPYFAAVILVRHEAVQKIVNSEWLAAGAILAYVLVFPHFSFYDTGWLTQVFRIGLSLCVIALLYRMNDTTDRRRENRLYAALCICGENSLAIYVLHEFLMDYKVYLYAIDSAAVVGILSIAMAFLVGAICIVIARVIGISSWWKKILFGRKA